LILIFTISLFKFDSNIAEIQQKVIDVNNELTGVNKSIAMNTIKLQCLIDEMELYSARNDSLLKHRDSLARKYEKQISNYRRKLNEYKARQKILENKYSNLRTENELFR
jgi:septal ring factor EnvC (AmiA/AmiB activator)